MAVTGFIPTIVDGRLLLDLPTKLVSQYGVNHDYSGDVSMGNSVKINQLVSVSVGTYDPSTPITYENLSTTPQTMNIDSYLKWSFFVDDITKVQAAGNLLGPAMESAVYKLAKQIDSLNFSTMSAGVASANVIGGDGGTGEDNPVAVTTTAQAKQLLLDMKTVADKNDIPDENRVFYCTPEFENLLLGDTTLNMSVASADTIRAGYVGRLYGVDIFRSNNLPTTTGNNNIAILTHSIATTEASQLQETEAIRSEKFFGDNVRGLYVSGRKVIRPTCIVKSILTYSST